VERRSERADPHVMLAADRSRGWCFGDFKVVTGRSKDGGEFCPAKPSCDLTVEKSGVSRSLHGVG